MKALEYLDPSIPFLKTSDSVEKGLDWLEEYKVGHIPVVHPETNEYLGLASEIVLLNEQGNGLKIADIPLQYQKDIVKVDSHIYDALSIIGVTDLDVVPVVDGDSKFAGVLTSSGLLKCVAQLSAVTSHGGIVELMMNSYDYSMVEIARAVESNGAKILSSYISNVDEAIDKIKVILKLNINDISLVVAEFQQLSYTVVALYSDNELPDNTEDNYKHLFKYLDL